MQVPFTARPTIYNGVRMRSRLEARFAGWLDRRGLGWEYEPTCFGSPDGQYLPDFRLQGVAGVEGALYVEVKPARSDLDIWAVLRRMEIVWASEPEAALTVASPHDLCAWSFPLAFGSAKKWTVGTWSRCGGGCESLGIGIVPLGGSIQDLSCCVCSAHAEPVSPWMERPHLAAR